MASSTMRLEMKAFSLFLMMGVQSSETVSLISILTRAESKKPSVPMRVWLRMENLLLVRTVRTRRIVYQEPASALPMTERLSLWFLMAVRNPILPVEVRRRLLRSCWMPAVWMPLTLTAEVPVRLLQKQKVRIKFQLSTVRPMGMSVLSVRPF